MEAVTGPAAGGVTDLDLQYLWLPGSCGWDPVRAIGSDLTLAVSRLTLVLDALVPAAGEAAWRQVGQKRRWEQREGWCEKAQAKCEGVPAQ